MVILASALALGASHLTFQSGNGPLLMQHPTVNRSSIVFTFAGDLWSVPREGGDAKRLTDSPGQETNPYFSPDGSTIAFSAEYEGQVNIYTMPADGGVPKRLTFAFGAGPLGPAGDTVLGWSPDGKNIVFESAFQSGTDLPRMFEVSVNGGLPKALPFPSGSEISFSPDGQSIAYDPGVKWQAAWKRYRGGQTSPIWIGRLSDSKVTEIPRNNSNDNDPMWVGGKIYFISDRKGPTALYSYDVNSKKVDEVVKNDSFDFKSASAGPDAIVIEQLGSIKLVNPQTGDVHNVSISINGDFPEVRPRFAGVSDRIASASVSPTGARAIFEARGEIFTVPASKGDVRDVSQSPGVMDRSPIWSPDGKSIAYFSDASGEYQLVVEDSMGNGTPKSMPLGDPPAYYFNSTWSPDSKKIAYVDNRHNIWCMDLDSGKSTLVDTVPYENPVSSPLPSWSPDSKWITYHRELDNHLYGVFVYSLESGKATQISSSIGSAMYPVFDLDGKYLYFVASTNVGQGGGWLDLTSYGWLNVLSSPYVVVLRNDLPTPFPPESDEERTGEPAGPPKPVPFRIDLQGIDQRILAIPMPARNYSLLDHAGPDGFFAVVTSPIPYITSGASTNLLKFDMNAKQEMLFSGGISGETVSADGSKILIGHGPTWNIVSTAAPSGPGQGTLDLSGMMAHIDPKAEWKQMFNEALRIQRDYFYDPNHHGQDLNKLKARYEPFVDGLASRADLTYLLVDMLGEISVGHMFISGGDVPRVTGVPTGLLGADYVSDSGRYKFSRVYTGENWYPGLRAPLTAPGVNVHAGEYLLAINGRDLKDTDNIYEQLQATAGKQVSIKVGPSADGSGSRTVTVVPVPSEYALRNIGWMEDNRRLVDKMSDGKLGYAQIPDTNVGGWVNFNRYYYSQIDKDGMVIDERFNHGGEVDNYMVETMERKLNSMWTSRYGKDFTSPDIQNFGPKVLIVNQYAGSGGDYFPWHFKHAGVGPVIGHRTWGGLVGILGTPPLMDGGSVTSPNVAFWNPDGPKWDVENHGVDPDIDVDIDPFLWRQGHDSQLERAVEEAMKLLAAHPKKVLHHPPFVDKSKIGG